MLGRNSYTKEEIDQAKALVDGQVVAYQALAKAGAATMAEAGFFNALLLTLDRCFVHRVRGVSGKDGNPLNEVELLVEGLMNGGGKRPDSKVLKVVPADSITKIEVGAPIELTEAQFVALSTGFFAEVEARFT